MKTSLLTGSTGGLGGEIAKILAKNGWNLILINRDKEKADKQIASLNKQYPKQDFHSYIANLIDLEDIRKASQEIAKDHTQINALYNIAGLLTDKRIMNPQNIEAHFALNSLAPYLLVQSLRSQLKAIATPESPSIIVNFSTAAVNSVKTLDTAKLINPDTIGGLLDAYAKTKTVLSIMACFLEDELSEDNVYIYSADPGATKTQMTSGGEGMPWFLRFLVPLLFGNADKQAQKLLDGVDRAIKEKQTAVFISNGKVKKNPAIAYDKQIQNDVRALMDSIAF